MTKLKIQANEEYEPLFVHSGNIRYIILMGGRGAGRSVVASQFATSKLFARNYFRCAIMRYIQNDIRNSIYQEIQDRLDEMGILGAVRVREQDLMFKFGHNSIKGMGFKKSDGDQKSKLKSLAAFTTIIIEEADEVLEEDFQQLDDSLRTVKSDITIILLLNPPDKNHWIIRRWFNLKTAKEIEGYEDADGYYIPSLKEICKDNTIYIRTDYYSNIENISQTTQENYEKYRITKPDHYWSVIRGLVSEGVKGRIFTKWKTITKAEFDELPYQVGYGLDFGFSNDPTALIAIKEHNDKVYVHELIYQTGMTNPAICREMDDLGVDKDDDMIGDSAEPKSIKEISDHGYNIIGQVKGPDSVNAGLDLMLEKEVYVTEESEHILKEQENYKWKLDANKEATNKPIDKFNHAMDAIRGYLFTKHQETECDIL